MGLQIEAQEQGNKGMVKRHYVGWEDGQLYSEPMNPKLGTRNRLVVPLVHRNFLISLAHKVPLAGHLGIRN